MDNTKNIYKGYNISESMGTPSMEDFEIIKEYVSSDTTIDDIFVYKLKLCDNEIDRDLEQFSTDCLYDIASLFKGKVGVYDHDWQSSKIHSRIYKAYPVTIEDKFNTQGEPYTYVEAFAYTTKENIDLINDIKKGLKKEVSVGISGSTPICSICGEPYCTKHKKGLYYNDKLCYNIIKNANDAYEFSFVAVNAQKAAGVEKKYNKGGLIMDVRKSLLALAKTYPTESNNLLKAFEELEKSESVKVKELTAENESLKAKLKEYEDKEEIARKEEYMKNVLNGLNYRNEKAKGFGDSVIAENEGMEAEELHNLLVSEYDFLFEDVAEAEEVVEDLVEDIVETVEEPMEESETVEKEESEEVVEDKEKEEITDEDELKAIVEKKLKAFRQGSLNIEGLSSNLNREPKSMKKVQSGMTIKLN